MQVSKDIEDLIQGVSKWIDLYTRKREQIKEMESVIDCLKEELKMSREAEHSARTYVNKVHESLAQVQGIIQEVTRVKAENHKLIQEKKNLEGRLIDELQSLNTEREEWDKEKAAILENHEVEVAALKKSANDEVYRVHCDMNRLRQETENTVEELKHKLTQEKEKNERQLNQTIGNYEEKLMKMNEELANAQTEIRNLRQRWATANVSFLQRPLDQRSSLRDETPTPHSFMKPTPEPIITGLSQMHSQSGTSSTFYPKEYSAENKQDCNGSSQTGLEVKKVFFPAIRKRKLFSRTDDYFN